MAHKWALSPEDLACFANSPSPATVLRTWGEEHGQGHSHSYSHSHSHSHSAESSPTGGSPEAAADRFLLRAKKLIYEVGTVFRAKLVNNDTQTVESSVVVVVSVSDSGGRSDTTGVEGEGDDYHLTVFSGVLPLHCITLNDCPLEREDLLWECWCSIPRPDSRSQGRCGRGDKEREALAEEEALWRGVTAVRQTMTQQRWSAGEVRRVLPLLLKRHGRTMTYNTAEPELARAWRQGVQQPQQQQQPQQGSYLVPPSSSSSSQTDQQHSPPLPQKSMHDLVRLYHLISDHRDKQEVRDKQRKEQYRHVLRVFLCADFLASTSTSIGSLPPQQQQQQQPSSRQPRKSSPSKEDISEWLSLYCAYNFSDLFT